MTGDQAEAVPHLFVYGTLMRGSRNPWARLLQARADFLSEAFAPGRLHHLGRFPGAVFDGAAKTKVFGEVFRLRYEALLDALDGYEGCRASDPKPHLFIRTLVNVRVPGSGPVTSWAYALSDGGAGRPVIASGRFVVR